MKTKILLIMMLALMGMSCSQNNLNVTQQDKIFPDKIGYQWTYRLIAGNDTGSVLVQIVGEGTLPNGNHATIWKYTYTYPTWNYVDSVWVSYLNNVVKFYDKPCLSCTNQMPNERLRYVFPFAVGKKWFTNAFYGDTTKVLQDENVSVPAGTFSNVFRLSKTMGYVTNSWTLDTIYFKQYVGLVKFDQNEFSLGPMPGNGVWELVSYNFGNQ